MNLKWLNDTLSLPGTDPKTVEIISAYLADSGLSGNVYGNPKFEEGANIITAPVVGYNADDDVFVTRSGSKYKLGKMDSEYAEMFPEAKSKLISAADKRKEKNNDTMHADEITEDIMVFQDEDDLQLDDDDRLTEKEMNEILGDD